jgi:trk system potassium uptake protein TrkA
VKIVVIGAGRVGWEIAAHLAAQNHDVVVVEQDETRQAEVADQLDVIAIDGNGASPRVLGSPEVEGADLLLAVTDVDEVNITACFIASMMGVNTNVARVRDPSFAFPGPITFADLGINLVINPERETVMEAVRLIERPAATEVVELAGGTVHVAGVAVNGASHLTGRTVEGVTRENTDLPFSVVAIRRGRRTLIPTGADVYQAGDEIFFLAPADAMDEVMALTGPAAERIHRVAILGGGRIGGGIARELEARGYRVVVVEPVAQHAERLARDLSNGLVLQGDASDFEFLEAEGIFGTDALIAVTNDEALNILACLFAKRAGVRKTMTLLTEPRYIPLMSEVGIDAALNPRLVAISSILRFLRRGQVVSAVALFGVEAEVMEFVATPRSRVVGSPLMEAMPTRGDAMVGLVVKGDTVSVATGYTVIAPGDKAVVFALPGAIPKVERLFA